MNFKNELITLLSSNHFIIYIETKEEERLEYILKHISQEVFYITLSTWNFIEGYTDNPNYTEKGQRNPLQALEIISSNINTETKIFFLKDFYLFISDLSIGRKLKNINNLLRKYNKYIVISGINNAIPDILQEYITYVKLPLPGKKEIEKEVDRFIYLSGEKHKKLKEHICNAYIGYTINKLRQSISKLLIDDISENQIRQNTNEEKKKFIEQTEILEIVPFSYNISNMGGLINLKNWLKVRRYTFTKQASVYGIKQPRGIILVGIQGTGKSLSARVISKEWNMPLLKLDISKGFAGILGESESKMKRVIEICEKISPCLLWIDEIDKIFTQNNYTNDSGTTNRVTNIFLTWLSEKQKNVFIIATANNLNSLPIEMLRKGRFDEIFFVDLPSLKERIKIFQIHLKRVRPMTWHKYNIFYLGKISKKFSGAEIEQSIVEAMYKGFYEQREFTTKDISISINHMIPLAKSEEEAIVKMRKWGYSGKISIA
uniref:Uncharacterized AAA domain-containing protein ycf46 n=1 Tax=Chondria sp. (in: red algae) TaxID=1982705 RepID=A0A1Z1MDP7_9FLOR|nr:hypothetical protein [Chondria sp. (in: red algae)]